MVQYAESRLDAGFAALSEATRRGVLEQLGRADASITDLVWTNDEGDDGGAVTTATLEEQGGRTLLVVHDLYPSREALDGAIASGSTSSMPEALGQLDELLATLGASVDRS